MNNRGQELLIIILLVAIVVIGVGGFAYFNLTSRAVDEANQQNCRQEQIPYEIEEEYLKTEYYTETVPYTEEECEYKEFAYNTEDINTYFNDCTEQEEKCVNYFLGLCTEKEIYCIEKQIGCSVIINNVDNEKGYWYFDFNIYVYGNSEPLEIFARGATIYAQGSQNFQISAIFTGKENAEKDYYCKIDNLNSPEKRICEEVTRYKEVQREKQITAYRPITKYKTETVCD